MSQVQQAQRAAAPLDPELLSLETDLFERPEPTASSTSGEDRAIGLVQDRGAARPNLAPLLQRRLRVVGALGSAAAAGGLVAGQVAHAEMPAFLGALHEGQVGLNLAALVLNAAVALLLRLRRFAERPLRVLELLLFSLNVLLFVLCPVLLLGKAGADYHALSTLLLVRCIFIPDTPLRTALVSFALASVYPLSFLLAPYEPLPHLPPEFASEAFLRMHFVWGCFNLSLSLAIGLVAVQLIHGLRMRAFRAERAGGYRLLEPLGGGGMGEVFRAQHAFLRRPTAVKMLRTDLLGSPTALRRFEREVRAVSELTCPHTISIYDFGKTEDGRAFYAMEFLTGVDLQHFVERFGPMEPERVVFVLEQVLASLNEAHRRGILHRDVKPSNLFLTVRGLHFDFVKVLDFGLVKHLAVDPGSGADLTADNAITGSPLYMAPERFYGDRDATATSDLYSLGAVAYYLLSGQPVFAARTPMQVLVDHVKTPPEPLHRRGVKLSESLERAVLKALEKSPERRFTSAEDFILALSATPEAGRWTAARARRWWFDHLPEAGLDAARPITAGD